jgi:hypothetical protein
MKLTDDPTKVIDEVITEVRAIKRAISQRHGDDIDHLLASLIAQERDAGIGPPAPAKTPPPQPPRPAPSSSGT